MFGPTAFQPNAFQTIRLAFQIGNVGPGGDTSRWSGFINMNMGRMMIRRG